MLGLKSLLTPWHFSAQGKHLSFKDFVSLGQEVPLMRAFSSWLDRGLHTLRERQLTLSPLSSWRFWTKGPQKNSLVCGLLKGSCDRLGRAYPFFIMGSGFLKGWEGKWDLMPLACEKTWLQMEYITTQRFSTLKDMSDEIFHVPPPHSKWKNLDKEKETLLRHYKTVIDKMTENSELIHLMSAFSEEKKDELVISLQHGPSHDQFDIAAVYHFLLKNQSRKTPQLVFLGGNPERSSLIFYNRALQVQDFVQLFGD